MALLVSEKAYQTNMFFKAFMEDKGLGEGCHFNNWHRNQQNKNAS